MALAPQPLPRDARPGGYAAMPAVRSPADPQSDRAKPARDLARIKRNVAKMASMGAPTAHIDGYIESEGVTVEEVRAFKGDTRATSTRDLPMGYEAGARVSSNVVDGAPAPPVEQGLPMNLAGGMNRALLEMTGGLVDRSRNVINWGVAGLNALTGQDDLTTNMLQPGSVVGDSDWIARNALEPVGIKDPRSIVPVSLPERLAAATGEGIAGALVPELLLGTASRLGTLSPSASEALAPLLGNASSLGGMARNAVAGGTAGAGAAAAMEAAPDQYKPLAGLAGALGGGVAGSAAASLPQAARAAGRMTSDYLAPLTDAGRQRLAGQQLQDAATSPGSVAEALAGGAREIVPGSQPTTFQQTGDMGLGALERRLATQFPDAFQTRRAEQNSARMGELDRLKGDGSADAVVTALRERLAEIDELATGQVDRARATAQRAAADIGSPMTPDVAGEQMRGGLEAARAAAKQQERALWSAVDPDGTLALPVQTAKAEGARLLSEMPATAKPPSAEEAAIFDAVQRLRPVARFSDVTALQSRIKTEMRLERLANGESPAYRRLTVLNDGVQRDLESIIARKVADDASAVQTGEMSPGMAMGARVAAATQGAPGTGNVVFTPTGRRLEVEYRVVDADSLTPSNLDDMRPNPAYPAELQPRNRTRAASELQVSRIAAELQPERLGASSDASTGAPIVGPDGFVESGNARMLALRKAYGSGGRAAADYRAFLESQGYATDGMRAPVLVRVRKTELDPAERVRFAQEANAGTGLAVSASERAATDAKRLNGGILDLYRGGEVTSAENRDFVRSFLANVADSGEEGAFTTRDGRLSVDGARRVQGALLRAAYDDNALIERLLDAGDEDVRAFGRVLSDLAGDVARLKAGIAEGRIDPAADGSASMVSAARVVQAARQRGISLSNAIAQQDAFDAIDQDTLRLLQFGYGENLAGRLTRGRFEAIVRGAILEAEQQTTDARLFGEAAGFSEILQGAGERYARQSFSAGAVPDVSRGPGAGGGTAGPAGVGPVAGEVGPEGATGRGVLPQPPDLEPNFTPEALNRLRQARTATRERVETFDNKTLGPLRRRPSSTAPYDIPASSVAGRIFSAGPRSVDAVRAYRAAVGDEQALSALEGYAVDRLRRAALREDGTLDPSKASTWRRQHSDVLREFPELGQRIDDAVSSSEAFAAAAAAQREALAAEQLGTFGRLLKLEDPADVVPMIGALFGRSDSASMMLRLRAAVDKSEAGKAGLRRAVAEHIASRFVSNTEAGASGVNSLRSDQLQSFVRKHKQTLRTAGFSESEVSNLQQIADDLHRANRSQAAVRLPGQSNTAQDTFALQATDNKQTTYLKIVLASLASAGGGSLLLGGPVGMATGIAGGVVGLLRQNGIRQIDELLREAMLNPGLARVLLAKVKPGKEKAVELGFSQLVRRALMAGSLVTAAESGKSGKEGSK